MKRILIIISLALVCVGLNAAVTAVFQPRELQMNKVSTFTFDPVYPHEQPILTRLTVSNLGAPQKIKFQMVLKWNGNVLVRPNDAIFITKEPVATGQSIYLSNRDLVSKSGSVDLEVVGNVNIDLIEIVKGFPTLERAVLSGYFPDGELQLEISVKAENSPNWEATDVFRIKIRNAGAIYPISPGQAIGQVPPVVKDIPVSFLWNAINTGFDFNKQHLVIKEFPPNSPPSYSTVAQTGVEIYRSPEEENVDSGFSDYIPFSNEYYYAWRIYTPLRDRMDIPDVDRATTQGKFLASEWFVFRYIADHADAPSSNEVQAMLNILGNPILLRFLNMGLTPTGEVILDGRSYTGQPAIDILDSLVGKDIRVELKD